MMMMASMVMLCIMMVATSKYMPTNFVSGLSMGIFMGMASLMYGFSMNIREMLKRRK